MRSILRPIILVGLLGGFGWYIYTKTDLGISLQGKTVEVSTGSQIIDSDGSTQTGSEIIGSIDSLLVGETTGSVDEVLASGSLINSGIIENTTGNEQSSGSQPIQIYADNLSGETVSASDTGINVQSGNIQDILPAEIDQIITESEEVVGFRKGTVIKNYQSITQSGSQTTTGSSTGNLIVKPQPSIKNNNVVPPSNTTTKPTRSTATIGCKTPWGTNVKHGDYTIAFKSNNANVCEFEKRYCYQGNLQGSFTNHTCHFSNSQGTYLFKGQKSQSLDELIKKSNSTSYADNYSLFGGDQEGTKKKALNNTSMSSSSTNQKQSSSLSIGIGPIGTGTKLLNEELLAERNPNNNGTIIGAKRPLQRTNTLLASSSFKDTYQTDKTILQGGTCKTPWGQLLGDGQSTIAFEQQSTNEGLKCNYETRYCDNGVLQGTFQYPICDRISVQELTRSCGLGNRTIPHGGVIIAAQKAVAKNGEKCIYEARYCNNGSLQGSYQYPECTS